jgi:hypothetical protein
MTKRVDYANRRKLFCVVLDVFGPDQGDARGDLRELTGRPYCLCFNALPAKCIKYSPFVLWSFLRRARALPSVNSLIIQRDSIRRERLPIIILMSKTCQSVFAMHTKTLMASLRDAFLCVWHSRREAEKEVYTDSSSCYLHSQCSSYDC